MLVVYNLCSLVVIIIVSVLTYVIASFLKRNFNITPVTCYLLLGIVISFFYVDLEVSKYMFLTTSKIYLYVMFCFLFFIMGLSINLLEFKKQVSLILNLGLFVSIMQISILSFITYLLLNLVIDINFFVVVVIISLFSMTNISNIANSTFRHLKKKRLGERNILQVTLLSSLLIDIVAIIVITFSLVYASSSFDFKNLISSLAILLVLSLLAVLLAYFTSIVLKKTAYKVKSGKVNTYYYLLVSFTILLVFIFAIRQFENFEALLIYFTFLVSLCFGLSLTNSTKVGINRKLSLAGNRFLTIFAYPIIYISISSVIELKYLLNVKLLIIAIIITLVCVILKTVVSAFILEKYYFDTKPITYVISSLFGTGASLAIGLIIFKHYYEIE